MTSKIQQSRASDQSNSQKIIGSDLFRQQLLDSVKITNSIQSYKAIHSLFQEIQKQNNSVVLLDADEILILKSCKSLAALGYLYKQEQIKLHQREKEFRENIRNQIDELQQQNLFKKAFLFDEILECKSNEQFEEISTIMKTILNVLICHGNDSFHFIQIFDIVLSALLLTANNRSIGRDLFLLQILDTLQRLLEASNSAYLWTIVLEQIMNASTVKEGPMDYVQPNLVARIILAKIPFMDDLFNYLGKYLGKCYKFEYKMFESMLLFGVTQQSLELILKLSKNFVNEFQMEIIEEMRKGLVPMLIKYMRNLDCFDQIQNLFLFFLFSPTSQISKEQFDYQSLQQIITNYNQNFDRYKENHIKRIGNFLQLAKLTNYQLKIINGLAELDKKLRSKYYSSSSIESVARQEQFSFWLDDNQFDERQEQKKQTIVGLRNLLNTCYLNSFLQVLFWTLDFRKLIMEDFKREKIEFLKPMSLKTNFLRSFIYLDSMTEEIDFTPLLLKRSLREPYRTDVRQQDAGEFGAHLFEDMEKSFEKEEYQKIKSLFCGVSKSTFMCGCCNRQTQGPDEEFMILTLNFDNEQRKISNTEKFEKMLERHLSKEQIQYKCEKCNSPSANNYRSLEFSKLSNNLIFQINRFEFQGGVKSKISEKVELKSIIEIKQGKEAQSYELYAIIIHLGPIPDAGHYTAYCKVKEIWYKFDDSIVTKLDSNFEKVQRNFRLDETPYLLFFRRNNK